ncbi:hypothetical protein K8B33_03470 [Alcanivorax sp. JB21]|uniref:hypothetical protein n=1 Tax=Alcanivorax limicola TaxID=2874102 RepID=UPI001CBC316D|nr:hypothetical protein [Alcanivorax limicola]MBZ2188139.1 hypothetical protein [Alcanivorax limicola]
MEILLVILVFFFSILVGARGVARDHYNMIAMIPFLTAAWGIVPAYLYINGFHEDFLGYGFQNIDISRRDNYEARMALVKLCFICLCFSMSAFLVTYSRNLNLRNSVADLGGYKVNLFPVFVAVFIWLANLAYVSEFSPSGLVRIFSPAYFEDRKFSNYIVRGIHVYLPIAIATVFLIAKRPARTPYILISALVFLVLVGTGQRRELIVWLFYWALLSSTVYGKTVNISIVKASFISMSILVLFVILWAIRVYVTNLFRGEVVDPFSIRSPGQVLFGSAASGFSTFLIVMDYTDQFGVQWFYSIIQGLVSPIPRFMWEGKPVAADGIIQLYSGMRASPSLFWFGDLYFSFGALSYFFAFLSPFTISFLAKSSMSVRSGTLFPVGIWMSSGFITLFKNGIGTYLASSLMFFIFCGTLFLFSLRKV